MILWFVLTAPFLVAEIFKSPMVDYRMVALGAALPLIEVVIGQPFFLHTLAAPVLVLTIVMLGTMSRRLVRRRLLGIPIGMFFHLILDGSWTSASLIWWPAFGLSLADEPVPELTGVGWRILLEVIALGIGYFAYRRFGLHVPAVRSRLLRTGHLPASTAVPSQRNGPMERQGRMKRGSQS